jgi:hypothetical protein
MARRPTSGKRVENDRILVICQLQDNFNETEATSPRRGPCGCHRQLRGATQ